MILEVKRGRTTELEGIKCDLCLSEQRYTRFATYTAWVMGRPLLQVCQPHRARARQLWEGALDAEEKAA